MANGEASKPLKEPQSIQLATGQWIRGGRGRPNSEDEQKIQYAKTFAAYLTSADSVWIVTPTGEIKRRSAGRPTALTEGNKEEYSRLEKTLADAKAKANTRRHGAIANESMADQQSSLSAGESLMDTPPAKKRKVSGALTGSSGGSTTPFATDHANGGLNVPMKPVSESLSASTALQAPMPNSPSATSALPSAQPPLAPFPTSMPFHDAMPDSRPWELVLPSMQPPLDNLSTHQSPNRLRDEGTGGESAPLVDSPVLQSLEPNDFFPSSMNMSGQLVQADQSINQQPRVSIADQHPARPPPADPSPPTQSDNGYHHGLNLPGPGPLEAFESSSNVGDAPQPLQPQEARVSHEPHQVIKNIIPQKRKPSRLSHEVIFLSDDEVGRVSSNSPRKQSRSPRKQQGEPKKKDVCRLRKPPDELETPFKFRPSVADLVLQTQQSWLEATDWDAELHNIRQATYLQEAWRKINNGLIWEHLTHLAPDNFPDDEEIVALGMQLTHWAEKGGRKAGVDTKKLGGYMRLCIKKYLMHYPHRIFVQPMQWLWYCTHLEMEDIITGPRKDDDQKWVKNGTEICTKGVMRGVTGI